MQLPVAGREYVTWTITGTDDATALEVSFDGTTWASLTRGTGTGKVLVAGPDAAGSGAITLSLGRNFATIRATDSPEIVLRGAGVIDVS